MSDEAMRAHKSAWEGGIGKKRLATDEEHRSRQPSNCINHPGFKNRGVYAECEEHESGCPQSNPRSVE